ADDGAPLRDVDLPLDHERSRGRAHFAVPGEAPAVALVAIYGAVEGREINRIAVDDRCADDVAGDGAIEARLAVAEPERDEVMVPVTTWIRHVDDAVGNRRLAHERIAEPARPELLAGAGVDYK